VRLEQNPVCCIKPNNGTFARCMTAASCPDFTVMDMELETAKHLWALGLLDIEGSTGITAASLVIVQKGVCGHVAELYLGLGADTAQYFDRELMTGVSL